MPDITRMGATAPLFEQQIETPQRRGHAPMAETSRAAWNGKKPTINIDHRTILAYLADHGPAVHDAMVANGLVSQSSSGRMGELVAKGMIEVIGTGLTRSGSKAKLCKITEAGRKVLLEVMK